MIGVGLVGFITIFASSTTASINASIDRSFAGDFVINSGAGTTGGVDPALAQKLNALPQVAAATGESTGAAVILGKVEQITAVDPGTAGQIFNVRPLQGSISALGADGIAVYKESPPRTISSSATPCPSCSGTPGGRRCGSPSSTATARRRRRPARAARPATSWALPPTTPTSPPPATTARCS